ncbi:protein NDUFAF4 homolog isoform X2 [Planococcus citri]|uniref:protein NDUFAF4 homolog isoform X2 n=1 Tax=Planococcus citri TaxID=170843 RepID=UPI0031F87FD0
MGNTFTVFGRHALKRVRRFNVQSRTEKYPERHHDKPERAPLYEATMREVEKLTKEMPDLTEEMKKKDDTLLNNLRKVYVTSEGDNKDSFSQERVDSSREAEFLQAKRSTRRRSTWKIHHIARFNHHSAVSKKHHREFDESFSRSIQFGTFCCCQNNQTR